MNIYKPFEKAMCPIKEELHELDPHCGISIDGMAVLVRRGQLDLKVPWGITKEIGFETRFHKVRVCNAEFQPLHPGYTQGNMLVEFSEAHRSALNGLSVEGQFDPYHYWFEFMESCVRRISLDSYEPYIFRAEVKVNSLWFPTSSVTAVGAVVDVLDYNTQQVRPCEVPVRARDMDYLLTKSYGPIGALSEYRLSVSEEAQSLVHDALHVGKGALAAAKLNPDVFGKLRAPTLQFI